MKPVPSPARHQLLTAIIAALGLELLAPVGAAAQPPVAPQADVESSPSSASSTPADRDEAGDRDEAATGVSPADPDARPPSDAETTVRQQLEAVFGAVRRFEGVRVSVNRGVVRLTGEVSSSADIDAAGEIAEGLEGVIYVDNELTAPAAVSDRLGPVQDRAAQLWSQTAEKAPLYGVALVILLLGWTLGKLVASFGPLYEKLLAAPILRDLAKRVTRLVFLIVSALIALELLDATTLVGTMLGAAGVASLAVGFAFRDIAENYLASFLLIGRRPFALGDSIEIGEHTGKVMRLTMRDTVLMTFDGNHLSLPNATVFKATVLNYSRNPRRRFDFIVGASADSDLRRAQSIGVETLRQTPGVVVDPEPFAQIEELGDSNVALGFYGWVNQQDADFFKTRSEAILRVKIAMENAGVEMPEPIYRVNMTTRDASTEPPVKRAPSGDDNEDVDVDVSPDHSLDDQIAEHVDEEENLLDER